MERMEGRCTCHDCNGLADISKCTISGKTRAASAGVTHGGKVVKLGMLAKDMCDNDGNAPVWDGDGWV